MMQFLEFTFQSFWHFVGVLILIATIGTLIPPITINKNYNDKNE
jgi:hypothetical protein